MEYVGLVLSVNLRGLKIFEVILKVGLHLNFQGEGVKERPNKQGSVIVGTTSI